MRRTEHGSGHDVQCQGDRHAREPTLPDAVGQVALHEVQQHARAPRVRPSQADQEGRGQRVVDSQPGHETHTARHPLGRVLVAQHHGLGHSDQFVGDLDGEFPNQRIRRRKVFVERASRHLGSRDHIVDRRRGRALLRNQPHRTGEQAGAHAFSALGCDSLAVVLRWHVWIVPSV
jgi:hypothetical protein